MRDVDELLRPLARVEPGRPDSKASGAGARALLASVTAHERDAVPAAPRGPRRLVLRTASAAVLTAGLVMGVVLGPSLLGGGGEAISYANAAVEIHREGDQFVARIKDPFADHDEYTEAFHAVGLSIRLRPVPVSPGGVGEILGMMISAGDTPAPEIKTEPEGPLIGGVRLSMDTVPKGCRPGQDGDCVMVMRVPAGFTGDVDVRLGRQAKPGEEYANFDSAMAPGEMFDGVRLRNGRPVDDILAEARERGLTATFSLIRMDERTGAMTSFEPLPADQVGPGWTVWNAWQVKAGVIRLLVTPGRLPENPFYNGSAPPPTS
ncbi:hypothetical protein [Nonomuraea sp. LPB2021202275-12-8]|uniref:hypothetical protein n=1 Tax=Nonomuraea sp. LPB2021202275-12-8 TaxID=3120159 RepID=UPI00300D8707